MACVVESKFVTGTFTDPIRVQRAIGQICEQHLVASIDRNIDFTVDAVPGNGRPAQPFAGRHGIWERAKSKRHFGDENDARRNK